MSSRTLAHQTRPVEIIFSCQVCCSLFSEIYADVQYDKGFRDTDADLSNRPVTKLWLTECCHLTCSKHFEGGGIPLHPSGKIPEAPCPVCMLERNDSSAKKLFGIRGFRGGEYDKSIPDSYFNTPPVRLDGSGKGMEALRFQYLALARFATHIFSRYKAGKASIKILEEKQAAATQERERLSRENIVQAGKIQDLERSERSLQHWKEREPKIMYYLGVFKQTMEDNHKLRAQLAASGESIPPRPSDFVLGDNGRIPDPIERAASGTYRTAEPFSNRGLHEPYSRHSYVQQDTASSRTLSGPPMQQNEEPQRSPAFEHREALNDPLKTLHGCEPAQQSTRLHPNSSRDSRLEMPPPPLPLKRRRPEGDSIATAEEQLRLSDPGATSGHQGRHAIRPGHLQEQGRILLNNDGTWVREELAQQRNSALSSPQQQVFSPSKDFQASETHHHDHHLRLKHSDDAHQPNSNEQLHQKNIHLSPIRNQVASMEVPVSQNGFRRPLMLDPYARQRPRSFRTYVDPGVESETFHGSLDDNIYHQQAQRQREPLEQVPTTVVNAQAAPHQAANSPRKRTPAALEPYRYVNQADPDHSYEALASGAQPHYRPASFQPFQSYYQPIQQPLTPSPTKRSVAEIAQSAASPFFKTNSARTHTGRLTLPDRRDSGRAPSGSNHPRHPQQARSYGLQTPRSGAALMAPNTPRDPASGLFSRQRTDHIAPPASPYFSHQAQGPVTPRANMFSAQQHVPSARYPTTQGFGISLQQDRTGIGRSGPSRMSLEGQRQGGGLGDYLPADGGGGSGFTRNGATSTGRVRRLAKR